MAVYDPDARTLQLMEARKMTVRSCVRRVPRKPTNDGESDGDLAMVYFPLIHIAVSPQRKKKKEEEEVEEVGGDIHLSLT